MGLPQLVEGRDYYVDPDGLYVFTAAYLSARGYCCRSGCRHCPYGFTRAAAAAAPQDANGDPGPPSDEPSPPLGGVA